MHSYLGQDDVQRDEWVLLTGIKHVRTTAIAFDDDLKWKLVEEMARSTPPPTVAARLVFVETYDP